MSAPTPTDTDSSVVQRCTLRTLSSHGNERGMYAAEYLAAGSVVMREPAIASVPVAHPLPSAGLAIMLLMRSKSDTTPLEEELGLLPHPQSQQVTFGPGAKAAIEQASRKTGIAVADIEKWTGTIMRYCIRSESILEGTQLSINLHPSIDKVNHSCQPNSVSVFNKTGSTQHLVALRNIPANEQISVAYWPELLTDQLHMRRAQILSQQDWLCSCTRCQTENACETHTDDDAATKVIELVRPDADAVRLLEAMNHTGRDMSLSVTQRRSQLAAQARRLYSHLKSSTALERDPSTAWFALYWTLRTRPENMLWSSKLRQYWADACVDFWQALVCSVAVDIECTRFLTLYLIDATMRFVNLPLTSLPLKLQDALASQGFKVVCDAVYAIETSI